MKRTHMGRVLAALGLGITTSVVVVDAPAEAVARISVNHSISVPGLVRHEIRVNVSMTESEAQSQIDNGARIQLECWGSDQFPLADHLLPGCPDPHRSGTVTYRGTQLLASSTGVRLIITNLYEPGSVLNEDIGLQDEIYLKARWIDASGATSNDTSSIVSGWF